MKGIRGLILALVAGIVGALCNWIYLQNKARDVEKIGYVGIRPEVSMNRGDRLAEEQLEEVLIPKQSAGNMDAYFYRYSDLRSVVGMTVSRAQTGPMLLLRQDLRTAPPELKLTPSSSPDSSEVVMWVPIDNKTCVPALITPNEDLVSFIVSTARPTPAPAARSILEKDAAADKAAGEKSPAAEPAAPPQPSASSPEVIGPFKVLAMGNRLASAEVTRAAKVSVTQENVMGVLAKLVNGKLEPKAAKLWSLLEAGNFRQIGVLKHAPQSKDAT